MDTRRTLLTDAKVPIQKCYWLVARVSPCKDAPRSALVAPGVADSHVKLQKRKSTRSTESTRQVAAFTMPRHGVHSANVAKP